MAQELSLDVIPVDLFSIDVDEADERIEELESLGELTPEDELILASYKQASSDKNVIELSTALSSTHQNKRGNMRAPFVNGIPSIAVARASWPTVRVKTWPDGRIRFSKGRDKIETLVPASLTAGEFNKVADSPVPFVPVRVRPKDGLENYYLLWEATWREAPTDPVILRSLGHDFFEVLDVYELTDLEARVIAKTRR